ncbi:glycosyltransferase family 2 protein [Polynucleobacter yangtzensis]|uniref:glycosyltransferase family 2 protein n=1 Tax=Polynucleobacter yangtzensis TaxID=1743159 RepID=UPI00083132BA|nr:glycosyltransferase [Polynucleobacter yangtzensis]
MHISLILTGSDRHADLARFYSSIEVAAASTSAKIELIFINQGSFDPPSSINSIESLDHIELRRGKLSLSSARNLGLCHVTGDIVGFPDDDCWYPPQVLESIANYFHTHPAASAICTHVYDPVAKRSYGGRPAGITIQVGYRNLFELPISVGIFVRKDAFNAVGLNFNEKLGAGTPLGSGEETELIYRILKNGGRVDYVGTIQVFHPVPIYQQTDIAKYYKYGLGFGYLNGLIIRDGEWRIMGYLGLVLVRSFGGVVMNLHRSRLMRLYWSRLMGIFQGFIRGVKDLSC